MARLFSDEGSQATRTAATSKPSGNRSGDSQVYLRSGTGKPDASRLPVRRRALTPRQVSAATERLLRGAVRRHLANRILSRHGRDDDVAQEEAVRPSGLWRGELWPPRGSTGSRHDQHFTGNGRRRCVLKRTFRQSNSQQNDQESASDRSRGLTFWTGQDSHRN